jgi:hypothetical protein
MSPPRPSRHIADRPQRAAPGQWHPGTRVVLRGHSRIHYADDARYFPEITATTFWLGIAAKDCPGGPPLFAIEDYFGEINARLQRRRDA